ncbi:hypothetical protein Emag_000861 [Eimeria magna]
MKKGATEKQQAGVSGPSKPDKRGLFCGETRGPQGFVIDKGGQHLMRTGFEPSVMPIGGGSYFSDSAEGQGGLFDGVGGGLVRRGPSGHYHPLTPTRGGVRCMRTWGPFYKSVNEEGEKRKIEVVYVGLDKERQAFEDSRAHMPWLSLQFDSPLRSTLIRRYRLETEPSGHTVLPGSVVLGLPRLLVVGPQGQQIHWLHCEHESPVVLREWDFEATQWPPAIDTAADRGDSCSTRPHEGDARDTQQDLTDTQQQQHDLLQQQLRQQQQVQLQQQVKRAAAAAAAATRKAAAVVAAAAARQQRKAARPLAAIAAAAAAATAAAAAAAAATAAFSIAVLEVLEETEAGGRQQAELQEAARHPSLEAFKLKGVVFSCSSSSSSSSTRSERARTGERWLEAFYEKQISGFAAAAGSVSSSGCLGPQSAAAAAQQESLCCSSQGDDLRPVGDSRCCLIQQSLAAARTRCWLAAAAAAAEADAVQPRWQSDSAGLCAPVSVSPLLLLSLAATTAPKAAAATLRLLRF